MSERGNAPICDWTTPPPLWSLLGDQNPIWRNIPDMLFAELMPYAQEGDILRIDETDGPWTATLTRAGAVVATVAWPHLQPIEP